MPFVRKKSYARKTRNYRKKPPYQKKPRRAILPIGGFPRSQLVKLRYCETISLDATAGVIAVNKFRANGLYDPNATGTGHQPSNFDVFAARYDNYTVLGSRCMASIMPVATNINPGQLMILLSRDGASLASAYAAGGIDGIMEQPRLTKTLSQYGITNGQIPKPIYKNFSTKKFFGVKDVNGKSPFAAAVTADPVDGAFFEVAVASADGYVDPGQVYVRVQIDYVVLFGEPKITDAA